jgi:hypothetical protein
VRRKDTRNARPSPKHRNRIGVAEMIANVIAIAASAIAIVGMFAASVIEY